MIVSDFLNSVLRLIGVIAAGETPSTEESADALAGLNNLINEWNTEHISIFTIRNEQFELLPNQGSYLIGTGGTFDTPRPVKIESAGIIQSNGLRSTLDILSSKEWALIPEKAATAIQPLKLYNDSDYPTSTIHLWPCPKCNTTTMLDLYMWQELTEPLSLSDDLQMPPGYIKALRYNLAVDVAPEYGRAVDPAVQALAVQSKNDIAGLNVSNSAATEDPQPVAPPLPKAA